MRIPSFVVLALAFILPLHAHAQRPHCTWQSQTDAKQTVERRIPPPPGFQRVEVRPGSFADWLRHLPLKPGRPPVHLYNGQLKANQSAHVAVVDIDVGNRNLQQCADAVMRLRAEYLFAAGCGDQMAFHFTSGDLARWRDWRSGLRPEVRGNRVIWRKRARPDSSYANFRRYLNTIFTYAGSASLERELISVRDPTLVQIGDVFIHGGHPGHAVIVVDVAQDEGGRRVFLLAQSYMPAQEIHILRSFESISPWYTAQAHGTLRTPEWTFRYQDLRRFPPVECE